MKIYYLKKKELSVFYYTLICQSNSGRLGFLSEIFTGIPFQKVDVLVVESESTISVEKNHVVSSLRKYAEKSLFFINMETYFSEQELLLSEYNKNKIKLDFYEKRKIKKDINIEVPEVMRIKNNTALDFSLVNSIMPSDGIIIQPRFSDYGLYLEVFTKDESLIKNLFPYELIYLEKKDQIPCW